MKLFAINLLFMLFSLSCRDQKNESQIDEGRSQTPHHPDVQFYILEAPQVGAIASLNEELWRDGHTAVSFSTGDLDEETNRTVNSYGMKTEYAGSSRTESVDYHLITISTPDSEPITTEVAFDGSEQVTWKSDRYKTGIRPAKP